MARPAPTRCVASGCALPLGVAPGMGWQAWGLLALLAVGAALVGAFVFWRRLARADTAADELERFFTISLDMLCVADDQGYFLRVNDAFERTLGYTRDELLSRPYAEFVHPDDRDATQHEAARLYQGETTVGFENRYRCKDGRYRWLNWTAIVDRNGHIYAAARDVTDMRRAQAELAGAFEFSRALEELGHAINGETDIRLILQRVCEACVRHCDIEDASILYRSPETGRLVAGVSTVPSQRGTELQNKVRPRGGTQRILESRSQLVVEDVTTDPELAAGTMIRSEGIRSYVGTPVLIGDDVLGVLYALSRTPRTYEPRTLHRLDQLALLAATALNNAALFQRIRRQNIELEQYAFVVSHDLKAPLRTVAKHARAMRERLDPTLDDLSAADLRKIVAGVEEADRFIDDLLALSRLNTPGDPEPVDPRALVRETVEALDLPANAQVRCTGEWPRLIRSRPMLLRQVFQNLISNGVTFNTSDHPLVEVSCRVLEPGVLCFEVSDNGIGIEEKYQQRIFKVFMRLHSRDEYPGTGIGLGIVTKACALLGGDVRVRSEPGEGSTFSFTVTAPIIEGG